MKQIWIPDSPRFAELARRLQEGFSGMQVHRGVPGDAQALCVTELSAVGDESMLQLSGGGGVRTEYRCPRDLDLLLEDVRVRLLAGSRGDSDEMEPSTDLPDLSEDVFTLGGLPAAVPVVAVEPAVSAPVHSEEAENDGLTGPPEVPEEAFGLGPAAASSSPAAPAPSGLPEESTSPGILRRNTFVASVDEIEKLAQNPSREFTLPQWNGDGARFFLDLHRQRFSGRVEAAVSQYQMAFSWVEGRITAVEGIAFVLARLLQLGNEGLALDLTRTLSDPIDWALRRRLIAPGEERTWLDRCRREAIRLFVSVRRPPVVLPGAEESALPPLDPRGPLFCGILEHTGADEACALCDGVEPVRTVRNWDDLFADPDFDPVWIRVLHLFSQGCAWEEACIRSGLATPEAWKLAYACRLFGLVEPALPDNPAAEIRRRRFRWFEENLYSRDPGQVFGNDPVAARRLQQEILLQFSQLPAPLRLLMAGDFEKLKKSMDKALSVLSF